MAKSNPKENLIVRMPVSWIVQLKKLAEADALTTQDIVRQFIREGLRNESRGKK